MSLLSSVFLVLCAQDPAAGAQKFAAGDFAGAKAAYERCAKASPETAAFQYDLAVAAFRAGDLDAAESAIDRYAALPGGGRAHLHHGVLGNIRYRQAEELARKAAGDPAPASGATSADGPPADPVAELEAAVGKAEAARDAFLRAAGDPDAGPEAARNTERSLRLREQLKQKLEDAKKQREEQQKDDSKKPDDKNDKNDKNDKSDKSEKADESQKDGEPKSGENPKPDDGAKEKPQSEQPQDQKSEAGNEPPKDGEARPEPKPEAGKEGEQSQGGDPGKEGAEKPTPPPPTKPDDGKDPKGQPDAAGNQAPEQKDQGEAKPEPQPREAAPGEAGAEAAAEPRSDAPGEQAQATALSPEQRARMMEQLKDLDQRLQRIRAAARTSRRSVERDW